MKKVSFLYDLTINVYDGVKVCKVVGSFLFDHYHESVTKGT